MSELLAIILSFPTVVFTALLGIALVYWVFVVVGALDIDTVGDVSGAKGAFEGLGGAKGAVEGLGGAKGALEGLAGGKGAVEGLAAAKAAGGGADVDAEAAALGFLKLRSAPLTVTISLFALFGWLMTSLVANAWGPGPMAGVPLLLGSGVLSLLFTSIAIRPLAPLFAARRAKKKNDLVGKIAVVSTGEVTSTFGQATLDERDSALTLQVRVEGKSELKRGDRVVLVYYDAAAAAFHVEKLPSHEDVLLHGDAARVEAEAEAEAAAELETGRGRRQI